MKNMILAIALIILFSMLNNFQIEMNTIMLNDKYREEIEIDE